MMTVPMMALMIPKAVNILHTSLSIPHTGLSHLCTFSNVVDSLSFFINIASRIWSVQGHRMHTNPDRAPRSRADPMPGGDSRRSVAIFLVWATGKFPVCHWSNARTMHLLGESPNLTSRGRAACACAPAVRRTAGTSQLNLGAPTSPLPMLAVLLPPLL